MCNQSVIDGEPRAPCCYIILNRCLGDEPGLHRLEERVQGIEAAKQKRISRFLEGTGVRERVIQVVPARSFDDIGGNDFHPSTRRGQQSRSPQLTNAASILVTP